jgi:hypothetical protein
MLRYLALNRLLMYSRAYDRKTYDQAGTDPRVPFGDLPTDRRTAERVK